MWAKVARFILRNRIIVLFAIAVITACLGYVASTRVKLQYTIAKLMPDDDPILIKYNEFKKQFGYDGNIMVLAIPTDSLYQLDRFKAWKELGNDLKGFTVAKKVTKRLKTETVQLKAIDSVYSEANLYNLVTNDSLKKFEFVPLSKNTPKSQEELDQLREKVRELPFYRGLVFSDTSVSELSEDVSLMMIFVNSEIFNSKIRGNLMEQIDDRINQFVTSQQDLYVSGFPYIRVQVANKIKKELGMFVALAAMAVTLILFLFFRNTIVVVFSLLVVGTGVIWALGIIGLFDYEISALMGLIPPLIIVIGVPNCVYLLNKYQAEYKAHGNKVKALQRVVTKIGNATFLTNTTTSLGFATFIFTQSAILIEFGIVASISIMMVFLLSIAIITASFSLLPPPRDKHTKHLDRKWTNWIIDKLVHIVQYHKKAVYVSSFIVLVVGIIGLLQIRVTGGFLDDIPEGDVLKNDLYYLENNFNGLLPFEIMINTNGNGKVTKTKNLKKINQLQELLKEYPHFSRSISIVDGLKYARQAFYGGAEEDYQLPKSRDLTQMEEYLKTENGGSEVSNRVMSSFVDSTQKITRVTVQIKDIGTKEMDTLLSSLEPRIDSIFNPQKAILDSIQLAYNSSTSKKEKEAIIAAFNNDFRKISRKIDESLPIEEAFNKAINESHFDVSLTGSAVVHLKGTNYLVKNLFTSLILAICVIAVLMSFLFRSVRMVLVSLIPNIIPLVVTAAIMGYFGIPLKPSTILVFSIAFGISIDDTIHYLAKYRQELKLLNWNIKKSVIQAIKETGVSMMYTSIILYFGFTIFIASDFGGTQALGILVSITLIIAMFSNLVLLPTMLLSFEKNITTEAFKEPFLENLDEEIDIELEELEIKA